MEPHFTASQPHRLEQARTHIAQSFPRPEEAVTRDHPEELAALLDLVRATRSTAETIRLARQLPARAIQLIFPILALPDAADLPARLADKLLIILRERACPSLYPKASVIWQQHYPHPLLTRALAVLCGILEIKQASPARAPSHSQPLLSECVELQGPAISRQLIARLSQKKASLNDCLARYAIRTDWAFGRSVLTEAFQHGTPAMFAEQIQNLPPVFLAASAETRARILRHFLVLDSLDEAVRQQAHVTFYRCCGAPDSDSPVWSLLTERERRSFAVWVDRARIGSHCLQRPEKAQFYLRYASEIRRVESWDDQTILIYFDSFVIADDNRYPEQALFYAGHHPSPHPAGLTGPDRTHSPGNPAIAHKRCAQAIQQGEISGIIQLQFDPEGLKESGVLIDFALQKSRGTPRNRHLRHGPAIHVVPQVNMSAKQKQVPHLK